MRLLPLVLALLACGRTGLGKDEPMMEPGKPGVVLLPCTAESCGQGLALGLNHSCALVDGAAWCWGQNPEGQLGFPGEGAQFPVSSLPVHEPRAVPTTLRFTQLVAGSAHTCGLASRGEVFCWGSGRFGQLGDGLLHHPDTFDDETPRRIEGLPWAERLEVGEMKTCALTTDDERWCWGGYETPHPVTQVAPPSFEAFLFMTGCLVEGGAVKCWGANNVGQLGVERPAESKALVAVPGLPKGMRETATPMLGSCALTGEGKLWCWGTFAGERKKPLEVAGLEGLTTLRFGFTSVCGLTKTAKVVCVDTLAGLEPSVFDYADIEDFSAGAWSACVRRKNREVWCQQQSAHGSGTELTKVATLPPAH